MQRGNSLEYQIFVGAQWLFVLLWGNSFGAEYLNMLKFLYCKSKYFTDQTSEDTKNFKIRSHQLLIVLTKINRIYKTKKWNKETTISDFEACFYSYLEKCVTNTHSNFQ